MNSILLILASLLVILVIIPICLYLWGTMFGKGFIAGIMKYFNKLKTDKNEEEEN